MTKQEYIDKQLAIFQRSLDDSFKEEPTKINLISRSYSVINPYTGKKFGSYPKTDKCYCLLCRNNKFYVSHIRPKTLICSECFTERYIDSGLSIVTDRTND